MSLEKINKKMKKILPIVVFFVLILPIFVGAQTSVIPNCGQYNECGYQQLLQLVNNIINWIIMASFPVAAGVFAWAGFKLMTTAVVDERTAAKEMFKKVFIGFVIILSAWIIVTTIVNSLLTQDFRNAVPVGGVNR